MSKRREHAKQVLVWVVCAGLIAGVGWSATSCLRQGGDDARAVTTAEAKRLAQVKANNAKADPAAMAVNFSDGAHGGKFTGQVDWKQPLINGVTTPNGKSDPDSLVQAAPGLVASHTAKKSADTAKLPDKGWTVRKAASTKESKQSASAKAHTDKHTMDIVLSAVMSLRSSAAGDSDILKAKASWVKDAAIDGAAVDVFRAPLLLDAQQNQSDTASQSGKASQAAAPEAIFWVDHHAKLRRVQFDPAGTGMTTVDFLLDKTKVDKPQPIDLLGGHANSPRDLSGSEVKTLSQLRQHNATTAAAVDLELPVGNDEMLRAHGYLDWQVPMVYLNVDAPGKKNDGLLLALPQGAATRTAKASTDMPPSSPPADGWRAQQWSDRVEDDRASDLDTLLFKLMVMQSPTADDSDTVKKTGSWLRKDSMDDTGTNVFELPVGGDPKADKPGQAPFRYWIDNDDKSLRRVELRTDGLGMAHADLNKTTQPQWNIPYEVTAALNK